MTWALALIICTQLTAAPVDTAADCDYDNDTHDALGCGGDDCDDADASVHPDAEDLPQDGVDQDCDGLDAAEPVVWMESGGCTSRGSFWLFLPIGFGLSRKRR